MGILDSDIFFGNDFSIPIRSLLKSSCTRDTCCSLGGSGGEMQSLHLMAPNQGFVLCRIWHSLVISFWFHMSLLDHHLHHYRQACPFYVCVSLSNDVGDTNVFYYVFWIYVCFFGFCDGCMLDDDWLIGTVLVVQQSKEEWFLTEMHKTFKVPADSTSSALLAEVLNMIEA